MTANETRRTLTKAAALANEFIETLPDRHVGARADADAIAASLGWDLPDDGQDAEEVIEEMVRAVAPGIVASAGPRYFGFVVGGALPASVGADWLAAAWDQNAVLHAASPAAAAVEQVAGRWMLDLLALPPDAGVGLPVGSGLGNAVGLAAARHALLARLGWDVEARGLYDAPNIAVVVSDDAHATLRSALQFLGLGRERVHAVPTDAQGRMIASAATDRLDAIGGPVIVCVQAGNVNTGSFDPVGAIAEHLSGRDHAWLHVDGAFGLWAAASPSTAHLVAGVERADSWATDAHKWLNVGYDCGFVAVRDADAHRAAMSTQAAYLMHDPARRDNWEWVLDSSRRARGFALYATLRSLGRSGVRSMVDRCCALARRIAAGLDGDPLVHVLNEVVLNQVLVAFDARGGGGPDEHTALVVKRIQADGTLWAGSTRWQGRSAMRISVSNWSTTEADADRAVEAIIRAARA